MLDRFHHAAIHHFAEGIDGPVTLRCVGCRPILHLKFHEEDSVEFRWAAAE